jgi:hypothetical protein
MLRRTSTFSTMRLAALFSNPLQTMDANRAEQAFQTFKDHFLAMLTGTAPTFQRDRWDLLLPQAKLTLNLLRQSQDPTMSAWHSLFGPYNFDATPMGPVGCRVLVHTKASIRRSWENRCHDGYYIGPSLVHYRCYKVLNSHSGAVTISDAVKFRHHYLPAPEPAIANKLLHAVQAIHNTIEQRPPSAHNDQLAAIEALRDIIHSFKRTTTLETPPPPEARRTPNIQPPPGVAPSITMTPAPGVETQNLTNPSPPPPRTRPHNGWTTVQRCSRQAGPLRTANNHKPIAN